MVFNLVDTAKSIKEVNDFFGVMDVTYRFFSASTLHHNRLVKAQKKKELKVLEIPHLSDTHWACHYLTVSLYKSRFSCLAKALNELVEKGKDRTEAAEASGILTQIQKSSFLVLLSTFDTSLGLTKPLSDAFQVKHSAALELVNSSHEEEKEQRILQC